MTTIFQSSARTRNGKRFKNSTSYCLALIISISCFYFVTSAHADEKILSGLFNNRALQRADASKMRSKSRARLMNPSSAGASAKAIGDAARLDTVDDILFLSEQRQKLKDDFHGLPLVVTQFGDVDSSALDEDRTRSFAQKLMVYQAARSFDQMIKNSELQDLYRNIIDGWDSVRRAATVQVSQSSTGNLRLTQHKKEGKLLEFKLHASVANGIEPQVNLTDRVKLRYDVLERDTLVEYSVDF